MRTELFALMLCTLLQTYKAKILIHTPLTANYFPELSKIEFRVLISNHQQGIFEKEKINPSQTIHKAALESL